MHSCLSRRTEIKDALLRLIDSLLQKDETRGRPVGCRRAAPLGGPPTSTEQVKFTTQPTRIRDRSHCSSTSTKCTGTIVLMFNYIYHAGLSAYLIVPVCTYPSLLRCIEDHQHLDRPSSVQQLSSFSIGQRHGGIRVQILSL
jgi:hypothetical protein